MQCYFQFLAPWEKPNKGIENVIKDYTRHDFNQILALYKGDRYIDETRKVTLEEVLAKTKQEYKETKNPLIGQRYLELLCNIRYCPEWDYNKRTSIDVKKFSDKKNSLPLMLSIMKIRNKLEKELAKHPEDTAIKFALAKNYYMFEIGKESEAKGKEMLIDLARKRPLSQTLKDALEENEKDMYLYKDAIPMYNSGRPRIYDDGGNDLHAE